MFQAGIRLNTNNTNVYSVSCCEPIQLKMEERCMASVQPSRIDLHDSLSMSPCTTHCHTSLIVPNKIFQLYRASEEDPQDSRIQVVFIDPLETKVNLLIHKPFFCPHLSFMRITDHDEFTCGLYFRVIPNENCQMLPSYSPAFPRKLGRYDGRTSP